MAVTALDNLEGSCNDDEQCTIKGSGCIAGKCQCMPFYATAPNGTSCLPCEYMNVILF